MANLLADQPSAYLKSAAHQPVHWHPWGDAAFAQARAADKPVLLDIGAVDTRYPFVLFVSQDETENVLNEWLRAAGVEVERGTALLSFARDGDGLRCVLDRDGQRGQEHVQARFLVGCDGAHSTVRKESGIPFGGGTYPQEFALGDVEADGQLEPDAINPFVGRGGVDVGPG